MTAIWTPRTVVQAIEDAAASSKTGYRFLEERSGEGERADPAGRAGYASGHGIAAPITEPFFTHAGIERASARFGGALQALGAKKGDRVALILPDNVDFVFTFLGAIRAGVVPVPIYPPPMLGKISAYLENTRHIVEKSEAKLLVTSDEIKQALGTLQAKAPELEKVIAVEGIRSSREELRPVKISLDDTCFLQFTSGSTSRPKGVILTHANLAANVRAIMRLGLGITDGVDSGVSWLPLYHDMGLIGFVIAPLYHTNTITFLPPLLFLKRPVRWLEAISRYRGSISFGPNFAYALCVKRIKDHEVDGLDLSSWRVAGCGAEPIRAENLQAFADKFARVGFNEKAFVCCYGMAESTLGISFSQLGAGVTTDAVRGEALWADGKAEPAPPGAEGARGVVQCGGAFEGHEVQVFALDDAESEHPLAERQVGELRLRGPSVTPGYFNDPEITREAFAGGWLRTGDLGYLAGGKVHICGRSKEVIIVNGRNYYPQDLEWEAGRVAGVRKGHVIAFGTMKPHNDRERVIVVFETANHGDHEKQVLKGEVRKAVQQALGLTVDDVIAVATGVLPKTSSGKLQRARARWLYETEELGTSRESDPSDAGKELKRSQLEYLRQATFGSGGREE